MMKKRKGMSLVEVMMSFVLVGFLVLLVSGAVTSSYQTAAAMQRLPGLYYKGQLEIENELDSLDKMITQKYLYEKELGTLANPDPDLQASLNEINDAIEEDREKQTVNLFGRDVDVYRFTRSFDVAGVGTVTLSAGTASGVRLERPVPVIESVGINVVGQAASAEITHADGSVITTDVRYSDTNRDYYYAELYQWYVSYGDMHTVYFEDGTPGPDEMLHGILMPVYPSNFTLILSERTSSMTVTDEYRGKFVFCLVTPLSINGKMGDSVMSNLIYISDLPDGPTYKAVIDPSLMVLPYDASGTCDCPVLDSTSAASGSFTARRGCPYVDQIGEIISDSSICASRFIHFDGGDAVRSSNGLVVRANDVVFAVVKSCDLTYTDFITAGGMTYGFGTYASRTDPTGGGWVILTAKIASDGSEYTISGGSFDLAELIIVSNAGTSDIDRITQYLKTKYAVG